MKGFIMITYIFKAILRLDYWRNQFKNSLFKRFPKRAKIKVYFHRIGQLRLFLFYQTLKALLLQDWMIPTFFRTINLDSEKKTFCYICSYICSKTTLISLYDENILWFWVAILWQCYATELVLKSIKPLKPKQYCSVVFLHKQAFGKMCHDI